jgi:uncharacterized repeat protein (TIGR03803 family)
VLFPPSAGVLAAALVLVGGSAGPLAAVHFVPRTLPFVTPRGAAEAAHPGSVARQSSDTGSLETILYAFEGSADGTYPAAALIADMSGVLYSTTQEGGGGCKPPIVGLNGCGTVFKLKPSGTRYVKSVLHSFKGGRNGEVLAGGLVAGNAGVFFGTTNGGGGPCAVQNLIHGCGTVFKLTPSRRGYVESVLHRFTGNDGAAPVAGLILDGTGALYGTTYYGGSSCVIQEGCGTAFKLTPSGSGYNFSDIHRFRGGHDGAVPYGGLVADNAGDLYGTTTGGGKSSLGTVFKLIPSGTGYSENVLYSFSGGSDGSGPDGGVIVDNLGALYGTTAGGGSCTMQSSGCGTVFKLTPSGSGYSESVLYSFRGGYDGWNPTAGLIADSAGALYGTTTYGGGHICQVTQQSLGCGIVFKLTPSGTAYTESVLHRFKGGRDGTWPYAGLIVDNTGAAYGTTSLGGGGNCKNGQYHVGCGTVFKLVP